MTRRLFIVLAIIVLASSTGISLRPVALLTAPPPAQPSTHHVDALMATHDERNT
jgi:hypothetical protein